MEDDSWLNSDDEGNSFLSSSNSGSSSDGGDPVVSTPNITGRGIDASILGDDDDFTSEKRVIKSKKQKLWEKALEIAKSLTQNMGISNWTGILDEWAAIVDWQKKAQFLVPAKRYPPFFIPCMLQLDDFITETDEKKELIRNMKRLNSQSFTAMKQRWRKYLQQDEEFADALRDFRESEEDYKNPELFLYSISSSSSDEGGLFSGNEPSSSTALAGTTQDLRSEKWNQEKVDKKVKEMLSKRGTRAYDKRQHYRDFVFLREVSEGLRNKLIIDFHILNALNDMIPVTSVVSLPLWTKLYNLIVVLLDHFTNNAELVLCESLDELGLDSESIPPNVVMGHLLFSLDKLSDAYTNALQVTEAPSEQYFVWLAHENPLLKLYFYAKQYYASKKDSRRATIITQKILSLLSYRIDCGQKGQPDPQFPQEDLKFESATPTRGERQDRGEDEDSDDSEEEDEAVEEKEGVTYVTITTPQSIDDKWDLQTLVPELCSYVCQNHTDDRRKRIAILELVYHYAIHGKFYEGRDLLLMTHLQEKIYQAVPAVQVYWNRALAQLGLAAFRLGRIQDAHNCLQELSSTGKIRELLAQGINVSRFQVEKSRDQEKQEQQRQIPYHMHINLELVECVHLCCAMLLEVPNMAHSKDRDTKKRVISKFFVKIFEFYDRQVFTGPPENTRETILVAAKALEKGDWKKCRDLILSIPVLQLLPNTSGILEMLRKEIQEAALRTYLFTFSQYYDSLSLENLSTLFELDTGVARAIICKMISNEDLCASWDQPTDGSLGALLIHSHEPTPLQLQALLYVDKINILLESVENTEQRSYERRGWNTQPQSVQHSTGQQQQQQQTSQSFVKKVAAGPVFVQQQKKQVTTSQGNKVAASNTDASGFSTRARRGKKTTAFKK